MKIGISAVVNACLNLSLIPKFSLVGVSVATVVTEGVVFALLFYFDSKHLYGTPLHKCIAKPLLASSIMGVSILYLAEINLFC